MCIFSGDVESVSETRIFARLDGSRQYLAYSMQLDSKEPVAMILPIPSANENVQFINLEGYSYLFDDLESAFPKYMKSMRGFDTDDMMIGCDSILEVHEVGSYVASYVPTIRDFHRLDARFRLPDVAAQLPDYQEFGFVVFQLSSGKHQFHPMSFSFETQTPGHLFFPTMHVHHGELPEKEYFDHDLYAQNIDIGDWDISAGPARKFVDLDKTNGLVIDMPLRKLTLKGFLKNTDRVFAATQ